MILAQIDPAKYAHTIGREREMSQAIRGRVGQEAEGIYLPPELFRRDFATGLNGGSNLIETEVLTGELADSLRARPQVVAAGARVLTGLTGNVSIPRKTSSTALGWVAEQGANAEADIVMGALQLTPKRISGYTEVSRQQMIQSSSDVEMMLRDDLLATAAIAIDHAAINGTGASNQPRGVRNTSGIGAVAGGTNGAQIAWQHIVDLEAATANANAPEDLSGYLINTKARAWLRRTLRGTNLDYILDGKTRDRNGREVMNAAPVYVSNNVLGNLTKGTANGICSSVIYSSNWRELLIGMFGGYDLIVDPYTAKNTATVQLTLNQFVDVGVRQPGAFSLMDDALTA